MKTKNNSPETNFDSAKVMREIRDSISREIMDMTYDEERAYLDALLATGVKKNSGLHPTPTHDTLQVTR